MSTPTPRPDLERIEAGLSQRPARVMRVVEQLALLAYVRTLEAALSKACDLSRAALGEGYSMGLSDGHPLSGRRDLDRAWVDESWVADEVEALLREALSTTTRVELEGGPALQGGYD